MNKTKKHTILVIDDEPNNITALSEILKPEYAVCAVIDSCRAVETAEDEMPDVILLDVLMPDMDGYEVITALKSSPKTLDIPVIFITGLDGIDDEKKGLSLGAADYISKPFHHDIVKIRVKNQIKLIERQRQQALMTKIAHSFFFDTFTNSLLTDTLRMVGEFMDIDQLLLYKLDEGVLVCQNEWIKPELNLETRIGGRFELNENLSSIINNLLISKESDLCLHSNDPVFKEAMKPYRVNFHNYITTPVFIKGKMCAAIDFSREDDGRKWDESEINLAILVTDVFSSVFERDAMENQYSIVENSPHPVLSINENADVIYVNPAATHVFGYTKREITADGLGIIFGNETLSDIIKQHIPCALKGETAGFESRIIRKNGEDGVSVVSLFQMSGGNLGIIIRDVTEIRKLEKENEKLFLDGLTNIYNRRYFDESIPRLIKSLSRSGSMLTLMMVDIDFFKPYNYTYGHSAGDDCLIVITEILKQSIPREDDFVARYGGEEFIVVLPNTDENGARKVAERMLINVRDRRIPHEKSVVAKHVTISIGIITGVVKHTHTAKDFIEQADMMLYQSKQNGRDKYSFNII